MNFYTVLNLEPGATKEQIKKAYHTLAIKYHPDKSANPLANQKFQEINTAYEILYDDIKRKEYDSLTKEERIKLYDLIKIYLSDINPKASSFFDNLIGKFYKGQETELQNDINQFNIKNIFNKIKNELIDYLVPDTNNNIYVTLKEKYENKYTYVKIGNNIHIVPIIHNTFSGENGQTINIIYPNQESGYQIIDKYDLLLIKPVSLYQYLYGSTIKINHFGLENILFEFDCCLEKKPIFAIENKGLPKEEEEEVVGKTKCTRGTLYIYLTIQGINSLNDDPISKNYARTLRETLELID